MGCVSSKKARCLSPAFDDVSPTSSASTARSQRSGPVRLPISSDPLHVQVASGPLEKIKEEPEKEAEVAEEERELGKKRNDFDKNLGVVKMGECEKKAVFSIKFGRLAECELVAAGWPAWLSAVAAEAIVGWLPLRSDAYERLEKIGQGTYSDVYRARDLKTSKMVAVKKVRFDNFQPESVSFMAREIQILRTLDHPNIMKLEGIIASRLSCTIYLVFEYMEHDLAGLISCPDVKFTDSQIKCYMRQLLSGIEHCHSQGILHRDIKSSNILVNNEGVLKIADFGLANFMRPKNKEPLTSRVVTLWYRAPELLLGSTNYGQAVDLWSVGCVFAEFFIGRPILKGRTEVEQLHKIFKLCGSPQDEYWKMSRLPLATMFKPQQPYESTLRERCKELPKCVVDLIETFLSIEPYKRGTASLALDSEYFTSKPYACEPSSLPKYPPNKEMDAKVRDDARRKKSGPTARQEKIPRRTRKPSQESIDSSKVIPVEDIEAKVQVVRRSHGGGHRRRASFKQPSDTKSDISQVSQTTQRSQSSVRSAPVEVTPSTNFAWAKRHRQNDVFTRLHHQPTLRSHKSFAFDPSHDTLESDRHETDEGTKRAMHRERPHLHRHESFDSSEIYEPQDLSEDYGNKKKSRDVFSGPLVYQSQEIASRQYDQPHQVPRRSRFSKD